MIKWDRGSLVVRELRPKERTLKGQNGWHGQVPDTKQRQDVLNCGTNYGSFFLLIGKVINISITQQMSFQNQSDMEKKDMKLML